MAGQAYAVIYYSWDSESECWRDDSYEAFASVEEAEEMFNEAFGTTLNMQDVRNPRVCRILQPIKGLWSNYEHTDVEETR